LRACNRGHWAEITTFITQIENRGVDDIQIDVADLPGGARDRRVREAGDACAGVLNDFVAPGSTSSDEASATACSVRATAGLRFPGLQMRSYQSSEV
jgi:hypothetical protein